MSTFIQLERTITGGSVAQNAPVLFDNIVIDSGADIAYNNGTVTFAVTGTFFVNWFVAQQTSLSTKGSNFAIRCSDGQLIAAGGHHKVSPVSGFGLLTVYTIGETIELWNTSDASAAFSEVTDVTAGLSVFLLESSAQGVTGPTGADGVPGQDGAIGPTGPQGIQGATGPSDLSGVHVQTTSTVLVQANEPIIFDTVILIEDPTRIDYSAGNFYIIQPGTYYISWQVPVDGTDTSPSVSFSLSVDGIIYSESYLPIVVGTVTGSALVKTTGNSTLLRLVNTTNDIVSVTSKANLVIVEAAGTR